MPRGYFRNVDDAISDPELIAARYRVGANVFFEVSLVLSEFADNIASAGGGSASQTPLYIMGIGIDSSPTGCPEVDEYVWIGEEGSPPRAVKAVSLLGKKNQELWRLYHPLTREFNSFEAELLVDVPLINVITKRGVRSKVSETHKHVKNTGDLAGTFTQRSLIGSEILSFDKGKIKNKNNYNVYQDELGSLSKAGIGDVVKITIKRDAIGDMMYVCGSRPDEGTVAHNRKPHTEIE